ncbi:hypothetical protein Pyn_12125 [Prunus yedoensis var. nudiflora]|uniref:Uncharacterized protein n=1 Tax=Prunus yedoensis var. nudiflora TaxID=2094558 RepID=A0A315AZ47_PRUYE|nr:hypothetical protein Pyn_12125 [Prunus yedoensis var. nudiflora]
MGSARVLLKAIAKIPSKSLPLVIVVSGNLRTCCKYSLVSIMPTRFSANQFSSSVVEPLNPPFIIESIMENSAATSPDICRFCAGLWPASQKKKKTKTMTYKTLTELRRSTGKEET